MALLTRKHKTALRKIIQHGLDLVFWLLLSLIAVVKSVLVFFRDFFSTLFVGISEFLREELAALEDERELERRKSQDGHDAD